MTKSTDTNALLISGGGVAGIATATAATMVGYTNIIVVEKRDTFTRNQKVLLSKDVMGVFCELSGVDPQTSLGLRDAELQRNKAEMLELTAKFLTKLQSAKNIVSIQDFQIYQAEFLKIVNAHGYCTILTNSAIESFEIVGKQNVAHIKNKDGVIQAITFDHLIIADGDNSKTLELLSRFLPQMPAKSVLKENTHNAYGYSKFQAPEGF